MTAFGAVQKVSGLGGLSSIIATPALRGSKAAKTQQPADQKTLQREERLTDEALAVAALRGDTQAFSELVSRFQAPVYSLAYRMLGRAQDAEDIAQETFLRGFSKLSSYHPDSKFGTWLLSIAAHLCIDQLRRKQSVSLEEIPDLDWQVPQDEEPESASLERETKDEVQALLSVLPPMYRAPLVLRYWYDHSYAEIASVLGITEATVKTRLFRARQMLAEASKRLENSVVLAG